MKAIVAYASTKAAPDERNVGLGRLDWPLLLFQLALGSSVFAAATA